MFDTDCCFLLNRETNMFGKNRVLLSLKMRGIRGGENLRNIYLAIYGGEL